VQAVIMVQVGSQVSGAVAWLGADFKSQVKRGQVIAKLDPALFQASVDTARANLLNAQAGVQAALTDIQNQNANIEAAKANDRANQALRDDALEIAKQDEKLRGVIPDREIEAAQNAAKAAIARYSQATSQIAQAQAQLQISQSKLKQAQAAVAQSQAQLELANVNLEHSIITSPIDGVVVSRNVDVGQTVAASLQAPTLFTIANDLTNMQVLASIDEADVGQVREGGTAHFTVDAFPGRTFTGDITQVRLNAQTLQNVVTYTAVLTVANPDQKLMPGMTANITIPVARRDDVLRIPNSALRFKPDLTDQQQKDLQTKMDAFSQQQQAQSNSGGDQQSGEKQQQAAPADAKQPDQSATPSQTRPAATPAGAGAPQHQRPQRSQDNSQGQPQSGEKQPPGKGRPPKENPAPAAATPGPAVKQPHQRQAQNANQAGAQQGAKQQPAAGQPPSGKPTAVSGGGSGGGRQRQIQTVWIMTANKTLEPHFIRTGITDGRVTEIVSGDLKEGDVIVIGQTGGTTSNSNSNSNRTPQATSPLSPRPPGAGAGRGR
jgi:multidrug resistance efflux pump